MTRSEHDGIVPADAPAGDHAEAADRSEGTRGRVPIKIERGRHPAFDALVAGIAEKMGLRPPTKVIVTNEVNFAFQVALKNCEAFWMERRPPENFPSFVAAALATIRTSHWHHSLEISAYPSMRGMMDRSFIWFWLGLRGGETPRLLF